MWHCRSVCCVWGRVVEGRALHLQDSSTLKSMLCCTAAVAAVCCYAHVVPPLQRLMCAAVTWVSFSSLLFYRSRFMAVVCACTACKQYTVQQLAALLLALPNSVLLMSTFVFMVARCVPHLSSPSGLAEVPPEGCQVPDIAVQAGPQARVQQKCGSFGAHSFDRTVTI
jgi:hypothetical protein